MRDTFYLIPSSDADLPFTRQLEVELTIRRAAVVVGGDVPVGSSLISHADENLTRAKLLAFVTGAGNAQDAFAKWQVVQFRHAIGAGAGACLVIVPQAPFVLPIQSNAKTVLLQYGQSAEHVARQCIAAARFAPQDDDFWTLPDRTQAGALSDGAWSTVPDLGQTYEKEATLIKRLLNLGHRDEASSLYWNIFHYSGYRERWTTRLTLSHLLVRATKQAKHYREVGLILSKGIAYVYMQTNRPSVAMHALRSAFGYFARGADTRGQGICWSYSGDLAAAAARYEEAIEANSQAYRLLRGVDQYEVHLKKELIQISHAALGTRERITRLQALRDDFAEVENYRVGIVDMELAKAFASVDGMADAIAAAERAAKFFSGLAKMPRNAKPANTLLRQLRRNARKSKGIS